MLKLLQPVHELPYGFGKLLAENDFQIAVATAVGAFEQQGFSVVAQIDLGEALRAKFGTDFRRYLILSVSDLALAQSALELDPHIGLLLPCNVVIQEGHGSDLYVAVETSAQLFHSTHHPQLKAIASEVERRLRLAVDAIP